MDDSEVCFGPSSNGREDQEETLPNNVDLSNDNQGEQIVRAERMVDETTSEMKGMMDDCMSDFSNKMKDILDTFKNRIEATAMSTPARPIRRGLDCPLRQDTNSGNNSNNSHSADRGDNSHDRTDIKCKIKPQFYDGSDDLEEYLTQFNLLAELNGWNYRSKALLLASSLSGSARAILNELTERERRDFDSLVSVLKNRFGSINRAEVFRAELQSRVRYRNETLPELAQSIKKLTRRAYPGTTALVRDTLALDYFIDAIPETEIRLRLREVGPKTINEAENIAVRLEAFRLADRQKGRSVRTAEIVNSDLNKTESSFENVIDELKEGMKSLKTELSSIKQSHDQTVRPFRYQRGTQNRDFPRNQNARNFNGYEPRNNRGRNCGNNRQLNVNQSENGPMSRARVNFRQQ